MKSDIRVCSAWRDRHDRPIYTLDDRCPDCGAVTANSAPPPYSPADQYGEYRRALKRRVRRSGHGGDRDGGRR